MQRSVTFEAKHPQISFCMPKKWTNTHALCTSKVTPRGAFWKFQLRTKGVNPPPPFFEVANFRQNSMTSHFAETPPPPPLVVLLCIWICTFWSPQHNQPNGVNGDAIGA